MRYHSLMPVLIDELPSGIVPGPLGDVLLAVQKEIESAGRIIVEVMLDGHPLVGDELFDRQNEEVGEAVLSIMTADPRELVMDTLGEIHRMLELADTTQREAADCFQRDDQAGAMERIGEAMTIWQQTERAVRESAGIMEISLDDLVVEGQTFTTLTAELITQLGGLRDLLAAGDTIALADTLLYEWPQVTVQWQKAIEALVARINA